MFGIPLSKKKITCINYGFPKPLRDPLLNSILSKNLVNYLLTKVLMMKPWKKSQLISVNKSRTKLTSTQHIKFSVVIGYRFYINYVLIKTDFAVAYIKSLVYDLRIYFLSFYVVKNETVFVFQFPSLLFLP